LKSHYILAETVL